MRDQIYKLKAQARSDSKERRADIYKQNPKVDLLRLSGFKSHSNIVAGFSPINDEINVWPLLYDLQEEGYDICLPVVEAVERSLIFRRWTPQSEMQTDRYGVSYPIEGAILTPKCVLVPLLAFTPDGKRLGYGGGYYDRTLAKLRAEGDVFACGVAYAGQEVADLPTDAHDERLDGILTEKEFRTFR